MSLIAAVRQLGDHGVRQRAIVDPDIINLALVGLSELTVLATRVIGVANAKQQGSATIIGLTNREGRRAFVVEWSMCRMLLIRQFRGSHGRRFLALAVMRSPNQPNASPAHGS